MLRITGGGCAWCFTCLLLASRGATSDSPRRTRKEISRGRYRSPFRNHFSSKQLRQATVLDNVRGLLRFPFYMFRWPPRSFTVCPIRSGSTLGHPSSFECVRPFLLFVFLYVLSLLASVVANTIFTWSACFASIVHCLICPSRSFRIENPWSHSIFDFVSHA